MQACEIIPVSIIALPRRKTGLHIRTADQRNVLAAIQARMKKSGIGDIGDIGAYLQLLYCASTRKEGIRPRFPTPAGLFEFEICHFYENPTMAWRLPSLTLIIHSSTSNIFPRRYLKKALMAESGDPQRGIQMYWPHAT